MVKKISKVCMRIQKIKWTKKETTLLKQLVIKHNKDWNKISDELGNKDSKQCLQKYVNEFVIKKKGGWEIEEDEILKKWVKINGEKKWNQCAKLINGRGGKQCRERWINVLNPNLKKGNWDKRDQMKLFKLSKIYFSKWSLISKKFHERSENCLKNYFYSSIRKLKFSSIFQFLTQPKKITQKFSKNSSSNNFSSKSYILNEISELNYLSKLILKCFLEKEKIDKSYLCFLDELLFDNENNPTLNQNRLFETNMNFILSLFQNNRSPNNIF